MKTIGVIGLGSIGMRHARNLIDLGHTVVGSEIDENKIKELRKIGGVQWGATNLMMHGVIIASPTEQHANNIVNCNAIPLFVEKPIKHTDIPIDMSNVKMVGYNLRYHGSVKQAKEWLDKGLIGVPLWANFTLSQYSIKEPYLRDGVILNWSHEIDLALYLLGPAVVKSSFTRLTDGRDDMTNIVLEHSSECQSLIHLDYVTAPEIREFVIAGTKGNVRVNLLSRSAILNGGVKASYDIDTWNDNYIEELNEFLAIVDNPNTPPKIGCTAAEALRVLNICLEVRKQAGLT